MKKKIVLIIVFCFFTNIVFANNNSEENFRISSKKEMSLNECLNLALQYHPSLKVAEETYKQAVAGYKIAKSRKNVKLSAGLQTKEYDKDDGSTSTDPFNVPGIDTNIALLLGVNFSYDLLNISTSKGVEIALKNLDKSKLAKIENRQKILYNVKKSYYNLLITQKDIVLYRTILDDATLKLKRAEKFFKSGQSAIQTVSTAQVYYNKALLNYENAKNREVLARNALFLSMGISSKQDFNIVPTELKYLPRLAYNVDELYELALRSYPSIVKAKIDKKIAKLQVEQAKSLRYPTIGLGLSGGFEYKYLTEWDKLKYIWKLNRWSPSFSGVIRFSVPIYSGGEISARIDSTMASYNKTFYAEKAILNSTYRELESLCENVKALAKQDAIASLVLLNSQRQFELSQKSYSSGLMSLLQVQESIKDLLSAERDYLYNKTQYMLTLAKISEYSGLSEEQLCNRISKK